MRQPSKSLPVALFFAKISEKEARELGKLSQPRTVKILKPAPNGIINLI
jgi:hypothetical protein